jgi:hypothetical protein
MRTFSIYGSMKSGVAEQASSKYKKIVGKNSDWYIALGKPEGDYIYSAGRTGKYSDGFGGRIMEFELEDGTIDKVQGPWHSNSDSLLFDTGYDATDKHHTQGIIALNLKHPEDNWHVTEHEEEEILHWDEEPVEGLYHRIDILAQEFATKLNKRVYYAMITNGGGTSGWKQPII